MLSLATLVLLLMAALIAFASVFAGHQPSTAAIPQFATYLVLALSVVYAALGVWAILTVIGILRLRSWARYSILIIGGGLAVVSLFGGFEVLMNGCTSAPPPKPMMET